MLEGQNVVRILVDQTFQSNNVLMINRID